jgi:hypothetical protein
MPYAAARRRLSASAIGTLPVSQSRISPVVGEAGFLIEVEAIAVLPPRA